MRNIIQVTNEISDKQVGLFLKDRPEFWAFAYSKVNINAKWFCIPMEYRTDYVIPSEANPVQAFILPKEYRWIYHTNSNISFAKSYDNENKFSYWEGAYELMSLISVLRDCKTILLDYYNDDGFGNKFANMLLSDDDEIYFLGMTLAEKFLLNLLNKKTP